jgi:hypothetical protein
MDSARRFATALHRCRHPLRLGGQQWRRRERRKQRLRRPLRRPKLVRRRSSRRRYRSSTSLRVEGRVTRAGGRRGRFQVARDTPAQVNNRGRRRDGGLSSPIVRFACGRGMEEPVRPDLPRRSAQRCGRPVDLSLSFSPTPSVHLEHPPKDLCSALWFHLRRRFFVALYGKTPKPHFDAAI